METKRLQPTYLSIAIVSAILVGLLLVIFKELPRPGILSFIVFIPLVYCSVTFVLGLLLVMCFGTSARINEKKSHD